MAYGLWPVGSLAADQKTALTGKLADVSGLVEVLKRGQATWVPAREGMTVGAGDQINTGIDGRATLKFESSTTQIQPLTQFVVGRAMTDGKENYTELFLQVGKVISKADQVGGKTNRFTVTTPTAVAGIRGTQQEVSFGEGFGTECKIEDGQGYMAPVQAERLPAAVQMALGVGPAVEAAKSAEKREGSAAADGAGSVPGAAGPAGEAVLEAAGSAAAGAPAGEPGADALSAALDNWLGATFDILVSEEAGIVEAAPEGEAPAEAVREVAPEEFGFLDESILSGEEIVIDDGQEAAISDPGDFEAILDPADRLALDARTDITAAGTTGAELEASLITTEIADAPVSELSIEESFASEELIHRILQETVQTVGGTTQEIDLFGQPPGHPSSP